MIYVVLKWLVFDKFPIFTLLANLEYSIQQKYK